MNINKIFTVALFASVAVLALPPSGGGMGAGGGGTPPGGDGGGGMNPGRVGPGGASSAFSYDSFILVTTNADATLVRDGLVYGYASAPVSVKADSTVNRLADGVFAGCTSLTAVDLSASAITEIPSDCFSGCTALKTVALPASCRTIGSSAFAGCAALVSATGPTMTTVGADAFRDCVELVTVPSTNGARIGVCAFVNCPKLKSFGDSTDDESDVSTGDDTGEQTGTGDVSGSTDSGTVASGSLIYPDFSKAQTIKGALCAASGENVGMMQIKIGKVSKKGYVKVSGKAMLVTGKSVSAKSISILLASDGSAAATLAYKSPLGEMAVTLLPDGTFTLSNGSYAMKAAAVGGALATTALKFNVVIDALPDFGEEWSLLEGVLPKDEPITVVNGTKWRLGKVPSVKFKKVNGDYVLVGLDDEDRPNVVALKLRYTSSTGRFKGSFRLYATNEAGKTPKAKKYTVKVLGFMLDGEGTGIATLKKPSGGPWAVLIE